MTTETRDQNIKVIRLGTTKAMDGETEFMVDFSDGSVGTLTIPANVGGKFIHGIHSAYFGGRQANPVPEVTSSRLGLGRDDRDQLVMKIDTAEAHTIVCILPPEQWRHLLDRLEDFDQLPLVRPAEPH
jgi:hypothetical protein